MLPAASVNTIPIEANGRMDEAIHLILIPSGSMNEKIPGISHLYEHLLIQQLLGFQDDPDSDISGYTSEDYILLCTTILTPKDFIKAIQNFKPEKHFIFREKRKIKNEIHKKNGDDSERFFQMVWRGTPYEKSPMGTESGIESLDEEALSGFAGQIQAKNLFFYSHPGRLSVKKKKDPIPLTNRRPHPAGWSDRPDYSIFFFSRHIEKIHLIRSILQIANPEKHIQVSEKKTLCALVIEKGVKIPPFNHIKGIQKKALIKIEEEVEEMKRDPVSLGINELESIYFLRSSWTQRLKTLRRFTTTDVQQTFQRIGWPHERDL